MPANISTVDTAAPRRQGQDLRLEASARALIWGSDDGSTRRLARTLTRAGIEATGMCPDVDFARDEAARTSSDLVIATADAVNQWLRRNGTRGQSRPDVSVPLLIVGLPTGPGSRELLLDDDIDFVAQYPTLLELRVRAARLLRQIESDSGNRSPLLLDPSAGMREFRFGDVAVCLTDAEFAIMRALTRSPGSTVSSAQLLEALRQHGSRCGARTNMLPVYVAYIRRKLAVFKGDVVLRTYRGRGYAVELRRGIR